MNLKMGAHALFDGVVDADVYTYIASSVLACLHVFFFAYYACSVLPFSPLNPTMLYMHMCTRSHTRMQRSRDLPISRLLTGAF